MNTISMTRVLALLFFISLVGTGFWVLGHENDPKIRDLQRPYNGPGYRSSVPGPQPFGPVGGFESEGVNLLGWVPLNEMGAGIANGNDCWGYTSPSGREYALMCHSSGTNVIEVTDPGNPTLVGSMISGPNSLWRDVKTYQSFAYVVSEGGGGIQVLDLSQIDNGIITELASVTDGGGLSSHNVAIDVDSGYLYRCGGGSNGLRFYRLQNPEAPVFEGSWSTDYVHDAQIVRMNTGPFAGREVAFLCTGNAPVSFDILDITVKTNIVTLGQLIYPGGAYSHQGWLSPDQQYFYLGDELDEGPGVPTKTFVIDVSDLTNPTLVAEYTNNNPAIGHNLYTVGDTIYEANYRSGMRVLVATDPLNIQEVGFFDTYPDDDGPQFNGLWSLYPYFPSGTVIGSDMERGLFVWSIGADPITFAYPNGLPDQIDPTGDAINVEITVAAGFSIDPQSPTLWFDDGSGWMTNAMTALGNNLYQGAFPSFNCGSEVHWYVSANVVGGTSPSTDPSAAPVTFYASNAIAGTEVSYQDDMEQDLGWTVGAAGDSATTGVWTRVDPIGTAAQPESDQSDPGVNCWVTGQGSVGGGLGENDVDGGTTTLLSPVIDLSGSTNPLISYWRWYSNNAGAGPGTDTFRVDISADNGTNWVSVEVLGPTGSFTSGGWFEHQFLATDFIALTPTVRLRFIAEDVGAASIVEAAIDELRVSEVLCNDCNGNGVGDDEDIANGTSADVDQDGIPDECQCNEFVRGEMNDDGQIDISDAVSVLVYLFSSGPIPSPIDRADVNGSGSVDVSDVVYLVGYLFQGGPQPPAPFPNPGCP